MLTSPDAGMLVVSVVVVVAGVDREVVAEMVYAQRRHGSIYKEDAGWNTKHAQRI